jgi:hypothetical protein
MDADQGWLRALELDLDALAQAETDLDRDAEVAERIRIERSSLSLFDRVLAAGGRVEIQTRVGQRIAGGLVDGAQEWLIVERSPDVLALIPRHAVVWIRGIGGGSRPGGILHSRSIASVYRQWARDRAEVRLHLADRSEFVGRLGAAYADHVDVLTAEQGTYSIAYDVIDLVVRGTE